MFPEKNHGFDAIIIGAGFAGMYLVYKLRSLGFSIKCFEAGSDVGGTWYWNRYPGARCDVPSLEYSYKFDEQLQQDWIWTERYAAQPEILSYARHVADRFDLRKDICFDTRVISAYYADDREEWVISTDKGETAVARFCIMATGALSSINYPSIQGLSDFKGEMLHTGAWPTDPPDLSGKRVGVIGTGSSGMQLIPALAPNVGHLHVFQRTAQYSIPSRNRPLGAEEQHEVKANYKAFREKIARFPGAVSRPENVKSLSEAKDGEIEQILEAAWERGGTNFLRAFSDLMETPEKANLAGDFVKRKISDTVKEPDVLEHLLPNYVIGCKRIVLDTGYFETYNRDNVTLVSLKDQPIRNISVEGVVTEDAEYSLDCIIFATGYDAMTGAMTRMDIRGRKGVTVQEVWKDGAHSFLGMAIHGFPNMFTVIGPGSPAVLANVITHIEYNVEWIANCMVYMRDHGKSSIEITQEAERAWTDHVREVGEKSLFSTCDSWYLGSNISGKPRVLLAYTGGFPAYTDKCDEVAARGYREFNLGLPRL